MIPKWPVQPFESSDPRPEIEWTPVPGEQKYTLSVKLLEENRWMVFKDIPSTRFRMPSLLRGTYMAKVRRQKDASPDGWSKILGFEIITDAEQRLRQSRRDSFLERSKILDFDSNLLLKQEEIREKKTLLESFPTRLWMTLGTVCNIDCIMCDNGRYGAERDEPVPQRFLDDLPNYLRFLNSFVVYASGEPFVYKELDRLCAQLEDYPIEVCITTNGTLVSDPWIERILRGNYILSISLDAATQETYEKIRKKSDYRKIIRTLEELNRRRQGNSPRFEFNFCTMSLNWEEIVPFVAFAAKHKGSAVYYNTMENHLLEKDPMRDEVAECDILKDTSLCGKVLGAMREARLAAAAAGLRFTDRVTPYILNRYPELIREEKDFYYLPDAAAKKYLGSKFLAAPYFCQKPFYELPLDFYGSYICCYSHPEFYSILYQPGWQRISDVWNAPSFQKAREAMLYGKKDALCSVTCHSYHKGGVQDVLEAWR